MFCYSCCTSSCKCFFLTLKVFVLIMFFHLDASTCCTSSLWCLFCSPYLCEFQLFLMSESIYTDCIHFQTHHPITAPVPTHPQRVSPLLSTFSVNPPPVPAPADPQRAPPLFTTFSANPTPPPVSTVASGSAAPAAPAASSSRSTSALRFIAAPLPPPPSPPAAAFSPSPSPSPPPPDGFIFDLVPPDDVS